MSIATAPARDEAQGGLSVAKLPVAIVGGHHRARPKPLLEALLIRAREACCGAEQRFLHLGDGWNGDLHRKNVVKHIVVAQIGVSNDIVADDVAWAELAAMTDHQPHIALALSYGGDNGGIDNMSP